MAGPTSPILPIQTPCKNTSFSFGFAHASSEAKNEVYTTYTTLARTLRVGSHPILAPDVLYQKTVKCCVHVSFYMWEAMGLILNDDIHYDQLERTLLYRILLLLPMLVV